MTAKNKPLYLAVKRNIDFLGLKKESKNTLYEDFHIIIQIPRKLPSDLWVDDELNKCCREVKNRQMIFHGIKIPLSHKLYFMVCALLLCGEIEEKDFNDILFRRNALKNNNTLTNGNLRKSLYDLKKTIKDTILSDCMHNKNFFNNNPANTFDEKLYKIEFNKFAYSNRDFTLKTLYKKGNAPSFLDRVCKKSTISQK